MGFDAFARSKWNPDNPGYKYLKPRLSGDKTPASTYASDTFAQLTRDQWASYVQNYVPFENKLIDYATDPGVVASAMSEASRDVNAAFDGRELATTRRLGGLGLTLDADEQQASTRSFGLARSLADVQGKNSARDATRERQQTILGNPMPRIGLSG